MLVSNHRRDAGIRVPAASRKRRTFRSRTIDLGRNSLALFRLGKVRLTVTALCRLHALPVKQEHDMSLPALPANFDDLRSPSPSGPGIGFRDRPQRTQHAGIETRVGLKPRSPRFPLDLAVTLSTREGKAWLRAADISAGGIKLRGAIPIAVGGRGVIRLAGLLSDMPGRLRWKAGNLSGFQFDKPMSRSDLFHLLTRR